MAVIETVKTVEPITKLINEVLHCEEYGVLDYGQVIGARKVGLFSIHDMRELIILDKMKSELPEDPQIDMIKKELDAIRNGEKPSLYFSKVGTPTEIELENGTKVTDYSKTEISMVEPIPSRFLAYCISWMNDTLGDFGVPVEREITSAPMEN